MVSLLNILFCQERAQLGYESMAWHLLEPNDKRVPLQKPRGLPMLSFSEGAAEAESIINEE